MMTKHKINMDLTCRGAPPRVHMVRSDMNSRQVEIRMTEDGAVWSPEAVDNVFLRYRRPDGTGGSYDTLPDGSRAWALEGNALTVKIAPQVLAAAGFVEAQAALLYGEHQLATFLFQIQVDEDLSADVVAEKDYINWTSWARAELDSRLLEAKNSGDFDGATYLPGVDEAGRLIWSNDQGKENPEPVDLTQMLAQRLGEEMFLRQSGGEMSGMLDMGTNRITGLAAPEADSDAVNRDYADRIFRKLTVSMPAILWSNGQISVQASGATADCLVLVSPEESTRQMYLQCGVRCVAQTADKLTFCCDTVPAKTVKANVVVFLRGDKA